MTGKTRSILLQVAFKEAAARGADVAATKLLTSQYFVLLEELHNEIGINADDTGPRSGGNRGGSGGASGKTFTPPASATPFTTADGAQWLDYRAAKANGDVKPRFPDFKSADGKESAYIYDPQGAPNAETVAILAAADAMATLTAPM